MNKPGTQIVSHRLDNKYDFFILILLIYFAISSFYNYRENGFGEDAYYSVLMQDGIVSPGTLLVNNPTQAIGCVCHCVVHGVCAVAYGVYFAWCVLRVVLYFSNANCTQSQILPIYVHCSKSALSQWRPSGMNVYLHK
jgi:hypothetical protein